MAKKKWKKILIWTVSIIFVLGVGGLFAANYAMNKLISSLSSSLEISAQEERPVETTVPTPSESPKDIAEGEEVGTEPTPTSTTEITIKKDNKDNPSTKQPAPTEYKAEITEDKAKEVQGKITVGEKAQLASVLLKELNADDLKALQSLAGDGLDPEEKKEARALILEKLSPEQYDELILIAKKYGLSQGRSYDEVSKDK
ncbi:hypothetical protein [Paenibacillus sp. L3-i20]|uniref:hypothetical protein n=1 Tax=Paenibacillus sp. L3-i20 TaxID=2905833 RepID=UPI001EDD2848|nr:hypothetical protein [Paenibacillus sp. L3-i20]GKU77031.1 hypothetical protein L3i20_v214280 [Paenibacillus sp. L3-i20]